MKTSIIAVLSGLIFGIGLGVSQMIDRERVLGFLDVAGAWDPSLMFVLGGAVGVTAITFRLVLKRPKPFFDDQFHLPTKTLVDRPLVIGSAIFGIGWGVAGYCPGPAITSLSLGSANPWLYMLAFAAGSLLAKWWQTVTADG